MTVHDYLKLPYGVSVQWDDDDEIFVARVSEIPECTGHGVSRVEAIEMAFDNLHDWIEDALESKDKVPEPAPLTDLPSGKWVQRVPRSVHAELVILAANDGVSLNLFFRENSGIVRQGLHIKSPASVLRQTRPQATGL